MKRRALSIFCLISLCMGLLVYRFYALSSSEQLIAAAGRQGTRTLNVSTTRGMIYDYHFERLINTEQIYVASVLPSPESAAILLHHVSAMDRSAVLKKLEKGELFTVELETPLDSDTNELHTFSIYKRYSDSQLAPHIIGHLTNGNLDGGYGIEKAYDDFLKEHTVQSSITYYLDAAGQSIQGKEPEIKLNAASDAGVVLTLDSRIQKIAEDAGEKYLSKGAVVIMTPDGKIRACASFPAFSPNNLNESLKDEEGKPMFNRAFGSYSVGSTFKIATAAAALESGVSPSRNYRCVGSIDISGQIFHCHNHAGHGTLDMEHAMAESCNPYFISLGLRLDKTKLCQTAKDLSFSKISLLAPGFSTQSGYLPAAGELTSPAAVANFSFGQGTLMATPIQVALMTCCIVNGGKTPSAQLVEGLSEDGKSLSEINRAAAPVNAVSEKTAEQIKQFLITGVMSRSGQNAKPTKTTAGGKTATAQTGNFKNGEEILQGWFTGFFPAEDPQYVVTVLCEEADSGNSSASPVFREIADRITEELLS